MTKLAGKHITLKRMNLPPKKDPEDLPAGVFEAPPVFSVAYTDGLEHFISHDGTKAWLGYDKAIAYPEPPYKDEALETLMLEKEDHFGVIPSTGQRYLKLPPNLVTMGQAMNDALSGSESKRSFDTARLIFSELGEALVHLANTGVVPKELTYKQVIFSRETSEVKLLPPLEIVPKTEEAVKSVTRGFVKSCIGAVATKRQEMALYDALHGFIVTFGNEWH